MKPILPSLLFITLLTFSARAVEVRYGSTVFAMNYTSEGASEPMGSNFIFELGAFDSMFTPTTSNMDQWRSHWTPLSKTAYNAKARLFQATATLPSNAAPFTTTNKGYIWGYRSSGGRNEWILMGNPTWKWPLASGIGFPVDWNAAQASNVVFGEVGGAGFEMKSGAASDQLTPPNISPAEWMTLYPTAGGWSDDADHDGFNNLMEYALGLCPTSGDANSPYTQSIMTVGLDQFLSLSVNRPGFLSVSYVIEFSSDLVTWLPGTVVSDTALMLHVRDASAISSSQPHRFVRLRVTTP